MLTHLPKLLLTGYFVAFLLAATGQITTEAELVLQQSHTEDAIPAVTMTSDARFVISLGMDGFVKIWDTRTGKLYRSWQAHRLQGKSICLSADERFLYTGGLDENLVMGTLAVWELPTGRLANATRTTMDDLGESFNDFSSLMLSPDGKLLVTGSAQGGIRGLDPQSLEVLFTLQAHENTVSSLCFSPGGDTLISADQKGVIKVWNLVKLEAIKTFKNDGIWNYALPHHISISADGQYLASFNPYTPTVVFDLESGQLFQKLEYAANAAFFVEEGDKLLTLGGGQARYWDFKQKQISAAYHVPVSMSLAGSGFLNQEKQWVALSGLRELCLFDLGKKLLLRRFSGEALLDLTALDISAKQVVALGSNLASLKLFDLKDMSYSSVPKELNFQYDLAFDHEGRYLYNANMFNTQLFKIDLLEPDSLLSFSGHTQVEDNFEMDLGSFLADNPSNNTLDIPLSSGAVQAITLHPDHRHWASGGDDGQVICWDGLTGKAVHTIAAHDGPVMDVAFIVDGGILLSLGQDDVVRYWLTSDGSSLGAFELLSELDVDGWSMQLDYSSLVYDSTQQTILIGGGESIIGAGIVMVHNLLDGELVHFVSAGKAPVIDLKFDEKHQRFAAASEDGNIYIGGYASEEPIDTLVAHERGVGDLAFSSDHKHLLSCGKEGTLKVWDAATLDLILTIIPNAETGDFLAVTPDNYYWSTRGGYKNVAYRVGEKTYLFEQFDLLFNRPDIILERLGIHSTERVDLFYQAYQKRLEKLGFEEKQLTATLNVPEIAIRNNNLPLQLASNSFSFDLEAWDEAVPLDRINVYVNDVPVYGRQGIDLRHRNSKVFRDSLDLHLASGQNKIEFSVLNQEGIESIRETVFITNNQPADRPDLYLIAIGVSEYLDSTMNLNYADEDARDLVALFEDTTGIFEAVKVKKLINRDVTRSNLAALKSWLMDTSVDDHVILYMAGHGIIDQNLDYYLATYDVDFDNPKANGLAYDELEALLDGIPARQKLLLLDACHSGELDQGGVKIIKHDKKPEEAVQFRLGNQSVSYLNPALENAFMLMRKLFVDLRRGTGASVITSASGVQFAVEGDAWGNGIFTYCLLTGLRENKADLDQDGQILVSELQAYLAREVTKLTKGNQQPTFRMENMSNDWQLW